MTGSKKTIVQVSPADVLSGLNDIEEKKAPQTLYTVGDLDLLRSGRRVSVVGSRNVSQEGVRRTKVLSAELVRHGITIVSGLAEGVDTIAHTLAITEKGGRTIAVLGTPVHIAFPPKNKMLHQKIASKHLLVSQFPEGYPFGRKNFPIRNRTMALLSDATFIVEAGEKSGTVHQGWEALRLGRPLFLFESLVSNSALSWPKEMIQYGAQVLTRDNIERVLDRLPSRVTEQAIAI